MPDDLLTRRENGVLIITINRPGQRNAVNGAVSAGIARALDLLDATTELRVGVLHGAGTAFCAGMDLKAFAAGEQIRDDARGFGGIVERPPAKPLIAAIEGFALAGGLEIALACDLVIAAESAKIGSVESTIGMNPLMGAMQRITQRAGAVRAKEMAMLGRRYDARTMERWNIFNRVVPDEQLDEVVSTLAQELAHGPTIAHAATKRIVAKAANEGIAAADAAMLELQADMWASNDLKAGLASLEANGPGAARFEGK
jgi:enoyl-CoA hydratase/carnithine racemase